MRRFPCPPFTVPGAILFLTASSAFAQAPASGEQLRGTLGALDWAVVAFYGIAMLAIGAYYARRTETTEDYYLGGRRMRPSLVGLSLFATLISTISYLANPGEVIQHGPVIAMMYLATVPFVFLIVGFLFIPYIMKLPITSAYELLDARFGRGVRLFGSCIFILIRLVWMGLVVFLSGKVVISAIGLEPEHIKYAMCALGVVTIVYSSMGGLRAVVLTDAIQSIILFCGAITCIIIISVKMGGFGWFPTQWAANWDTQPLFSFDPTVRVTVVGSMISIGIWWICTAGSDQMAIQRYLSTRDAKAARRAFLVNNIADCLVTIVLATLGFALLGFFRANPQYLSGEMNLEAEADYLFPHFIVNFMRFGMAGLVISGMLAAAMSSLSSGVNSASTVINTDIIAHFLSKDVPEARRISLGKWVSVAVGAVVILLGFVVQGVPGNIMEVTQKTNGLFVAPLFGLFFLAMFVPFATPLGAVFGSLYGFLAAFLVAFSGLAFDPGVSFQWILPTALIVNIAVGCTLSLVPYQGKPAGYRLLVSTLCTLPLLAIALAFAVGCHK